MDLFKRIKDLSAIYDDDGPSATVLESRPMFNNGGMLVQPSNDGSRPGYKGNKTYPFKRPDGKTDYRLGLDEDTGKFFKKIGKEDNIRIITQNEGESIEDFKKRKAERVTKVNDATVRARQYVDNWTKNWFDNNLKKYGINSFNVMMDDLSSAWQLQLESGDVPKGKGSFNLSTSKLKLPNITTLADTKGKPNLIPFKYNDITFYKNLESTDALKNKTLAQFKKVFYKDQINNNPKLQEDLTKFFDFMSSNKQGQYRKLDGKTIKDFMNTEVSDEVKFLLNPEISGLDKASKKEVFNSYSDFADNYNKYTEDKVRLKAVQAETEALAKVGKKTADQYLKVKADIAKQNDVLGKMSIKDIASNKELLNSVRMSINSRTGEVSYTNYTVNDPKGKAALTDLELAKKIKQKAIDKNFYVTEHIGKKSFNKANLAFPNNIQSANYMSNSQLENARRFLSIAENRNTPAAQNLDKTLENFKLTIRGPEYGDKRIGNKMDIVFDSKTGVSNIVQEQAILQNIQSYSKLPQCRIDKADGGRIGFAYSDECIRDGLKEQKIEAQKGNKKAARQLVETAEAASKGGRLLKNVLGPGAILSEIVLEGAIIGNKVLGGKPGDIAWAESYLSYLDPRKYRGELDPLKMKREDMTTREIEDADGNIKTIDGPNANILRSGFAAQDQLSAFNEALQGRDLAKARGRIDQYNPAAADAREQGRFADQSADIISSEAFKDASNMAQEYIQAQEGQRMFPYNQFKKSIGKFESGEDRDYRRRKEQEMKNLYKQFSDTQLMDLLENSQSLKSAGITPEQYMSLLGAGTKRITPAVTRTLSGLDAVRTDIQEQEALNRIAEAGGVANLAGGGIAKMAGDRSGAMTRSMNPDSQGLSYLFNRVKKV